jgi:DNA replication protein DnaC
MSAIEAATLPMLLTELRLPTIKRLWSALAEQSNREGWTAERFLTALCEHEMNERDDLPPIAVPIIGQEVRWQG